MVGGEEVEPRGVWWEGRMCVLDELISARLARVHVRIHDVARCDRQIIRRVARRTRAVARAPDALGV